MVRIPCPITPEMSRDQEKVAKSRAKRQQKQEAEIQKACRKGQLHQDSEMRSSAASSSSSGQLAVSSARGSAQPIGDQSQNQEAPAPVSISIPRSLIPLRANLAEFVMLSDEDMDPEPDHELM